MTELAAELPLELNAVLEAEMCIRDRSSPVAARGVLDDVVRQALVSVQRLIEASNGTGAITVATNLECSSTVVVQMCIRDRV